MCELCCIQTFTYDVARCSDGPVSSAECQFSTSNEIVADSGTSVFYVWSQTPNTEHKTECAKNTIWTPYMFVSSYGSFFSVFEK